MPVSQVVAALRPDRWNPRLQIWIVDTRDDGSSIRTCYKDGKESTASWSKWEDWTNPQFVKYISDIVVLSDSKGLFHLWIVDAENATVYLKEQTNPYHYEEWSDWQGWATPHERAKWIAGVSLSDGRLQVWMVDEAGNLWSREQTALDTPHWSDWRR